MLPTVKDIERCLTALDTQEFNLLVRGVLKLKGDAFKAVPLVTQLQMGLWEWLVHLGFTTDAQRRYILKETEASVGEFGWALHKHFKGEELDKADLPVWKLVIADERYVGWSGSDRWRDMMYEEEAAETEAPVVTTIACDLTALYVRLYDRLVLVRKRKDATRREHHEPDVPDVEICDDPKG